MMSSAGGYVTPGGLRFPRLDRLGQDLEEGRRPSPTGDTGVFPDGFGRIWVDPASPRSDRTIYVGAAAPSPCAKAASGRSAANPEGVKGFGAVSMGFARSGRPVIYAASGPGWRGSDGSVAGVFLSEDGAGHGRRSTPASSPSSPRRRRRQLPDRRHLRHAAGRRLRLVQGAARASPTGASVTPASPRRPTGAGPGSSSAPIRTSPAPTSRTPGSTSGSAPSGATTPSTWTSPRRIPTSCSPPISAAPCARPTAARRGSAFTPNACPTAAGPLPAST